MSKQTPHSPLALGCGRGEDCGGVFRQKSRDLVDQSCPRGLLLMVSSCTWTEFDPFLNWWIDDEPKTRSGNRQKAVNKQTAYSAFLLQMLLIPTGFRNILF